jgi:hypothetical protein
MSSSVAYGINSISQVIMPLPLARIAQDRRSTRVRLLASARIASSLQAVSPRPGPAGSPRFPVT